MFRVLVSDSLSEQGLAVLRQGKDLEEVRRSPNVSAALAVHV